MPTLPPAMITLLAPFAPLFARRGVRVSLPWSAPAFMGRRIDRPGCCHLSGQRPHSVRLTRRLRSGGGTYSGPADAEPCRKSVCWQGFTATTVN